MHHRIRTLAPQRVDSCDFVKVGVAHIPMMVLLFGDRMVRWFRDWSDLHSPKARNLDADIADMAERTRRICTGGGALILHTSLVILSADCCLSIAHAWLIESLLDVVSDVPELRELLRKRIFPLFLKHCVFLREKLRLLRKRGLDDGDGDDDIAAADWRLRGTTCDDIFAPARVVGSFFLYESIQVPNSLRSDRENRRARNVSEWTVTFAPGSLEHLTLRLRLPLAAMIPDFAFFLPDCVTFTRVSETKSGASDAQTARAFTLNPRSDCTPRFGQIRSDFFIPDDARAADTLVAYTHHDASRPMPAFAIRAYVCFCERHTFPQLKRFTVFRPCPHRPSAHRRTQIWYDAHGFDWLAMDSCGGGGGGSRPRPATVRFFDTCCPSWSPRWQSISQQALEGISSNTAARHIAHALQMVTPVFHRGFATTTNDGRTKQQHFSLTPRAVMVDGQYMRIPEGDINQDPAAAPPHAFLRLCTELGATGNATNSFCFIEYNACATEP